MCTLGTSLGVAGSTVNSPASATRRKNIYYTTVYLCNTWSSSSDQNGLLTDEFEPRWWHGSGGTPHTPRDPWDGTYATPIFIMNISYSHTRYADAPSTHLRASDSKSSQRAITL